MAVGVVDEAEPFQVIPAGDLDARRHHQFQRLLGKQRHREARVLRALCGNPQFRAIVQHGVDDLGGGGEAMMNGEPRRLVLQRQQMGIDRQTDTTRGDQG